MEVSCLIGLPTVATASVTPDAAAVSDSSSCRMQDRDPIHIHTRGHAAIGFAAIAEGLGRTNLIADVQRHYARMLLGGKQPEFVIRSSSPNAYYYVNARGERSDIVEVLRRRVAPDGLRHIYHVVGLRFFGSFEALIQVEIQPLTAETTGYEVDVYAYPEITLACFTVRHLPFIARYFQCKTREVVSLVVDVVNESAAVGGGWCRGASGTMQATIDGQTV